MLPTLSILGYWAIILGTLEVQVHHEGLHGRSKRKYILHWGCIPTWYGIWPNFNVHLVLKDRATSTEPTNAEHGP